MAMNPRKRTADTTRGEATACDSPRKRAISSTGRKDLPPGSLNGFQYQLLQHPRDIRVLVLRPALALACPLNGSIDHLNLDNETHSYSAVSYSWATEKGDATLEEGITIDEQKVRITLNLFQGLLRLRDRHEDVRLWIDALCINQVNTAERGRQVAMMPDIYRNSERTLVWFGEGSDSAGDRMVHNIFTRICSCTTDDFSDDHVRAVCHSLTDDCCTKHTSANHGFCACLPVGETLYDIDKMQLSTSIVSDPRLLQQCLAGVVAIGEFCAKRYWSRVCIVQELLLSDRQLWFWGERVMDPALLTWNHLELLHETIFRLYGALGKVLDEDFRPAWRHREISTVAQIFRLKSERHRLSLRSDIDTRFLDALGETSSMQCADPRDKIYALLGLADRPPLAPDYTKSTPDIYTDFAAVLVQCQMGHMILEQFTHPFRGPEDDTLANVLPSWVPDLRQGFRIDYRYTFEQFIFDAWLNASDKRTLTCRIFRLGIIGQDITLERDPDTAETSLELHKITHSQTQTPMCLSLIGHDLAHTGDHVFASSRVLQTQAKSPSVRRAAAMTMILRPATDTSTEFEEATYRMIQTCVLSAVSGRQLTGLGNVKGVVVNII